jgi:hypothetical protein
MAFFFVVFYILCSISINSQPISKCKLILNRGVKKQTKQNETILSVAFSCGEIWCYLHFS